MKFKRTTVAEIAKIAHLSPATVSRTLNHPELVSPTTSALVHSTINLLNSKAEPPIPDASDILQILVNIPDPGNLFYSELLDGILKSADFRGYRVLITRDLLDSPDSVDSIIRQIYLCNIQGMILCTSLSDAGYKKNRCSRSNRTMYGSRSQIIPMSELITTKLLFLLWNTFTLPGIIKLPC